LTPGHPLTMALKPNNTLDPGSGTYLVEGRKITGQNANNDFTFAPLNATCGLAVLSPVEASSGAAPAVTALSGLQSSAGATNAMTSFIVLMRLFDLAGIQHYCQAMRDCIRLNHAFAPLFLPIISRSSYR
jgi:hypothetical protein